MTTAVQDIRVDVNLYDSKNKSSAVASCVPLKKFSITDKKLSDLRKALVENNAIDAGKVGCSFCTPGGAQVNDTTSISDYLAIFAEKSSAGYQLEVHAVYLKTKSAKTDLTDETKEFLKKELDLKFSNKPELLKVSLQELTSSFDRANWAASMEGPNTSVELKEPPIVDLAFILKARKFQSHELSDSAIKVEQEFHIPRFVVNDDSYVDAFETKSSVSTSMARSSFSSIEAQASVGGGAFGFNAAVSAGFSQQESNALSSSATSDEKTMNVTYNFPRVVIYLDHHSLELTPECKADLHKVEDVDSLIEFHHKYGHFFATRIELGGRLFSSEKFSTLGSASEAEATKAMKIAASVSFSSKFISGSASFGKEDQTKSADASSDRSMSSSISWQAQGGDTLLCNNPPKWCPTVSPFQNWRVIKQEDVVSLGDFISKIPGYEGTRKKFDKLAISTKRIVPVAFRFRLTDWQRKQTSEPEYLTMYHASRFKNDFKKHVDGIKENELPTDLASIINHGHKGLMMDTQGDDNVFEIDVETVLDQAPHIEFNRRYKLYNRRNERWLCWKKVKVLDKEYPLYIGGYKSDATYVEFRDGSRTGAIRANDPISLIVYDSNLENQGIIALGLSTGVAPLDAMRWSPANESRIRWLAFESVEQRDVPIAA
ncbi:hypothetical protein N7488_004734 [Penicillium malachiteum]|nr:hypothetical protein N7488_004734 [Penicillium malachiteum]